MSETAEMRAKPTPGPWSHYDDSNSPVHRHQIAAMGKTVAHIYCTKGQDDEDRANARLIAAAPDTAAERDRLLAANAALVKGLEQITQWQREKCAMANAEILFMLLDNKVGIARAVLKAHGPEPKGGSGI